MERFLTPNPFSRPRRKMRQLKGICIHFIGVPNGRAIGVHNHFEGLRNQTRGAANVRFASAHETIDLDGRTIMIHIPDEEIAFGAGGARYNPRALKELGAYPNNFLYHIEVAHIDAAGRFSPQVYNTLVERVKDLCIKHKLNPEADLWRHFDITGKRCPLWFVTNPTDWDRFKDDVAARIQAPTRPIVSPPTPPPTPTRPATPPPEIIHTVVRGESLSVIANRYGVTVASIAQRNNIADPSRISINQRLVIPRRM